jgi:cytochrome c-type biogenesis protein CcmH/NrfG
MLWITIPLLLACVFVFLWHPSFRSHIQKSKKYQLIFLTTLTSFLLYGNYGSPLLPDHPFIRLEALSQPMVDNEGDSLTSLIKTAQENPSDFQHWKNLGDYYRQHRHYYESSLYYREAWKSDPLNLDLKILYVHSLVLLNNGHLTPTIQSLLSEIEDSSTLPLILQSLKKKIK